MLLMWLQIFNGPSWWLKIWTTSLSLSSIGLTLFKLGVMEVYMKLMTYEATMIDEHHKFVEEICLFK
jgi:hypothetical protein